MIDAYNSVRLMILFNQVNAYVHGILRYHATVTIRLLWVMFLFLKKKLCFYLSGYHSDVLLISINTVKANLIKMHLLEKQNVKSLLNVCTGRIILTSNM
jgi:hypothetical protein